MDLTGDSVGGNYARFHKVRDLSGDKYCCAERCTYLNADGYYLQYVALGEGYYVTESEPCFTSGSLTYSDEVSDDELEAYCAASAPTLSPVACAPDSETWYKDGSPEKDCAWVAEDTERCDSKQDADGVYGSAACPVACTGCAPADPAPLSLIHI